MSSVFLDRDGTLIRHIPYLCDPLQVELLPTVRQGLELLTGSGCKLFLHTNQSGIGRGYFSLTEAQACNQAMLRQIGMGGDLFVDVCLCPEVPGQEILYRKPSPKFALETFARHAFEKEDAYYVGDNLTDLLTAKNVCCHGVGVNTGVMDLRDGLRKQGLEEIFPVFDSFAAAAAYIVERRRSQ